MSEKRQARSSSPLSQRQIAVAFFAALLAAGAAAVSLSNTGADHRTFSAVTNAATIAILVAVGLFAWRRDPGNKFGRLLVIAGFGWFLLSLSASDNSLLYSAGRVSGWVEEVLLIYLFLSYPSGKLPSRPSVAVAGLAAATVVLLFLPTVLVVQQFPAPNPYALCTGNCPANAFALTSSEPGFIDSVIRPLREVLAAAAFLGTALILISRIRVASAPMRRTLAPVLAAAAFGAATAFVYMVVRRSGASDSTLEAIAAVRGLTTPVAAVGFMFGLVGWQLHEARALERLALTSVSATDPEELQQLLGQALGDPSLEIRYRAQGPGPGWHDVHGRPTTSPDESTDRCVVRIGGEGEELAAILCDPALKDQLGLVEAAGTWIEAAVERQRLTALLNASLRDVEGSRRRLATAAASERRRIERDLHDGAQQRLVTLRVQLELAAEELKRNPDDGARRLRELGPTVDGVIDEVRSLARGIYPPLLADAGLSEALRAVAAREAMTVTLEVENGVRYPLEVESAVYFCCLEALQNSAKHSGTTSVAIALVSGVDELEFEVRDGGAGFTPSTDNGGAGLTNMRDRLAAVGGVLVVDSSPGGGTRIKGEVPVRALA
jgi:signal transduction histidine kinase